MTTQHDAVIRMAQGSGRWFPGSERELRAAVQSFLDQVDESGLPGGRITAALSPHAGFAYSGNVAGHTFRALQKAAADGAAPETVVILGFTHRGQFEGVALMDGSAMRTPLGDQYVDQQAIEILSKSPRIRCLYEPHRTEHSAENQVPFLQVALPETKAVLALIGDHDAKTIDALVAALADLATRKQIVVVASTDLLHDSDYELVTRTDHRTLDTIVALDAGKLASEWSFSHQLCCGIGPVLTAMRFASQQGCTRGTLLRYRNSGDDYPESRGQWVVGYGAVAFFTPR